MLSDLIESAQRPAALYAGLGCLFVQCLLALLFRILLPRGPWTTQPGYTAHQLISFGTMVYVALIGSRTWFFPDQAFSSAAATTLSRATASHPTGEYLAEVLLGLNVYWDIPMGFISESLRVRSNAVLMFVHHVLVVVLCHLTLEPPRLQYYAIFFFGVIEVSSAPMALMDLCHPRNAAWSQLAQSNTVLRTFNSIARVVFAVSYLSARAVYFPYVIAVGVVPDLLELLQAPTPPVSRVSLTTILVSAILLTGLQLYWAKLLLEQALQGKRAVDKGN